MLCLQRYQMSWCIFVSSAVRCSVVGIPNAVTDVRACRDGCPLSGAVCIRGAPSLLTCCCAFQPALEGIEGRAAERTEDRKPLGASSRSDVSLFDVTHTEFAVHLEQLCVVGLSH